ncbi:conserved hypothetical protein [Pediculus humanus corporis]|uniref:Uncharacterized protein n=1 Tax=Pediculus humanus subsp. corporis TaxID=121224 RepID=E0VSA1_PEDHC|nr:uncharacterized protein Phum_PHUM414570 [Pediculus humanus corporis]EEB16257.1 conserved hypothetical protein [Pediculus humanus corporis]
MVKLCAKYLIRKYKTNKCHLNSKKKNKDTDTQFLKTFTHLQLQNQYIECILQIDNCFNIRVLYLHQNLIRTIENMGNFPNLTHLYLQRNYINKLENLNVLKKLKKIYLGFNYIQVLEGMENLKEIKEIHIECQNLNAGDTIYFEPLSIINLGETLQVLNISNNYLTSIHGLQNLLSLKILDASNNYLFDLNEVANVVSNWLYLQELNLIGNEITRCRYYKDSIIFASNSLGNFFKILFDYL